jgi:hypothetical protein
MAFVQLLHAQDFWHQEFGFLGAQHLNEEHPAFFAKRWESGAATFVSHRT